MSKVQGLVFRLRSIFRRSAADRETRDEIAYHLESAVKAYVARGMSEEHARRRALTEFGGAEVARGTTADARGGAHMEDVFRDVQFAFRSIRRRPLFAAGIVATLALGIGANVAMFSVIRAVLLRPVPVRDADQVVVVFQASDAKQRHERTSFAEYQDLAQRSKTLSALAAVMTYPAAIQTPTWSDQVRVALVTGNYFPLLGIQPSSGRLLGTADEAELGTTPFVVISNQYWKKKFGGAADVVGRSVRMGTQQFTVVGVAPAGFLGTDLSLPPDVWVPVTMHMQLALGGMFARTELLTNRQAPLAFLVGRVRDGISPTQVEAELNALLPAIRAEYPAPKVYARTVVPHPITVLPVSGAATFRDRPSLIRFVAILLGTVVLALLLACVSVANLLNVRGRERARETGVRLMLGAGTWRVVRQHFTESLVISLLGGAAGVFVALITGRLLSEFALPGGVRLDLIQTRPDAELLGAAILISLLTAIVFGLAPAIASVRSDIGAALRAAGNRTTRHGSAGLLISVQIAISLTLLVSASLFLRSVRAGLDENLGFDPSPLVAMDIEPRLIGYKLEESTAITQRFVDRAAQLPGVVSAAASQHVPLAPIFTLPLTDGPSRKRTSPTGTRPATETRNTRDVGFVSVTPDFFRTLGIPIVAGRNLSSSDNARAPVVIVVNRAAATVFWPGEDPLGKQLNLFDSESYTVVGVVADVHGAGIAEAVVPMVYVTIEQSGVGRATIVVRSRQPEVTLIAMRRLAQELNATVPAMNVRLVQQQVDNVLMPQRFGATLLSAFGVLALVISAVGVYSSVAFAASRRTAEFGVRVALGAQRSDILMLLSREIFTAVLFGAFAGLVVASGVARGISKFLYGIQPWDPAAFLIAVLVLATTACVAAALPARRASRTDPMRALRSE